MATACVYNKNCIEVSPFHVYKNVLVVFLGVDRRVKACKRRSIWTIGGDNRRCARSKGHSSCGILIVFT